MVLDRYTSVEVIENGRDREPWVPTPRHRRSLHAAVGVAVLATAGWLAAGLYPDAPPADQAATDAVELLADALPGDDTLHDGRVGLVLINRGASAVRLLSAELDAQGYQEVEGTTPLLEPGGSVPLLFNDLAGCGPSLLSTPASAVLVTARTRDGTPVTHSVPLSPRAFREVNVGARARCGYLPMEQALLVEFLAVTPVEGGAVATLRVANDSVLPLRVERLIASNGAVLAAPFAARDLRPLDAPGTTPYWAAVTLRLRVTDCAALYNLGAPRGARVTGPLMATWLTRDSSILETGVAVDRRVTDVLRRSCG